MVEATIESAASAATNNAEDEVCKAEGGELQADLDGDYESFE